MHVDAFFEYCLGHPHPYYTQLPASNAVVSESRDGVPLEEDLALRALVPEWKPKRGRKRAEERELSGERALKRPQLDTSVGVFHTGSFPAHSATFPQSAIPFSAFPEDIEPSDPWMATSSFPGDAAPYAHGNQQGPDLRWKGLERETSPAGHPQSAVIPRTHASDIFLSSAEPQSAITPSSGEKSRARRRHGPAVSSAWPNNATSSTGKMRGRPPNRGIVSGPFSSFPVNPNRSDPSHLHSTGFRPSLGQDAANAQYQQSPTPINTNGKPSKLQLQVPQHSGAPVRLATPPTLLVNGMSNETAAVQNGASGPQAGEPTASAAASAAPTISHGGNSKTMTNPDDVTQMLSNELVRAKVTGRQKSLAFDEARALASVVVQNLCAMYSKLASDTAALTSALHLGLGPYFGYSGATATTFTVHIKPRARHPSSTGLASANENLAIPTYSICVEYRSGHGPLTKTSFEDLHIGNVGGNYSSPSGPNDKASQHDEPGDTAVELDDTTDAEFEVDNAENAMTESTWKQRYLKLRAQTQKRDRSLSQYKRKILESVMADI